MPQTSRPVRRPRSRRCCRRHVHADQDGEQAEAADDCDDERDQASHRAAAAGREISSSVPTSSFEALDRRHADALVRRVRVLDLRAEREHVEAAVGLVADHGALETGVDREIAGRLAEHSLEDARGDRQHGRVEVGPPGAVVLPPRARRRPARPRLRAPPSRPRAARVRGPREAVQRQLRADRGLAEGGAQLHGRRSRGSSRAARSDEREHREHARGRVRGPRVAGQGGVCDGHVDAGIDRLVGIAD